MKYDKPALYELLPPASDNLKSELDSIYDDAPLTDFSELENKIHAFAATMKGQPATDSSDTSSADTDTYEGLFLMMKKRASSPIRSHIPKAVQCLICVHWCFCVQLGKMCEVIKTFS